MSFLLNIKSYTSKLNSVAKAMDDKVEEYVNEAIDKILEYDEEFFTRGGNEEVDKSDMKETLKKLFSVFDVQPKKKSINGYIFFTKENREDCSKRNPDLSPTQITSVLSQEWKALDQTERDEWNLRAKSVAPQTEEEKRAKRSSSNSAKASKKPATAKVTCEYPGCDKTVKNTTRHTDNCVYCATHYKKVVSDEKKAATPKCKGCKSDAINGEWCSKHMKKTPVVTVEPKTPVVKASPVVKPVEEVEKFDFKKEKAVSISKNPEWWKCKGIKVQDEKHRYHVQTGLILHISKPELIGTFIDGKITMLENVNDHVKEWSKKSDINVGEEDIDEELESEDEE
jgi:hypothetical protein